jgi:hypothetical protein
MNMSDMKNIVILKDLPSNLVDEAIVFLKQNQKIKKPEYVENAEKFKENSKEEKNGDFLANEAKMVIVDYILKIEKENSNTNSNKKKTDKKYKRIKNINFMLIVALFLSIIINLI